MTHRRFTPTCVGTARGPSHTSRTAPVHPHVRGDGACCVSRCVFDGGSPPRAWGRPHVFAGHHSLPRFTPTCVGTAATPTQGKPWPAVHPHVRGDGDAHVFAGHHYPGSPPRAWGRQQAAALLRLLLRFTPTCVGTATWPRDSPMRSPVHPHVRGDGHFNASMAAPAIGSPPRAWGRRSKVPELERHHRFTPTCVGTASARRPIDSIKAVHPHVRGDGGWLGVAWVIKGGSPPRAWGRRVKGHVSWVGVRFTPTCVGTAAPRPRQPQTTSVHPHVRGDGAQL